MLFSSGWRRPDADLRRARMMQDRLHALPTGEEPRSRPIFLPSSCFTHPAISSTVRPPASKYAEDTWIHPGQEGLFRVCFVTTTVSDPRAINPDCSFGNRLPRVGWSLHASAGDGNGVVRCLEVIHKMH